MKVKTSVTLSSDLLKRVDRAGRRGESRSATIERLVVERLESQRRHAADARDRALLDAQAARLNAEQADVLDYQAEP
jgi:metal-responsive CopG/Arc/MetJ family transcriptional regulator